MSVDWITGDKPDVPKGEARWFLVTVENTDSGEREVGSLRYMNAHLMPLSDSCCNVPPQAVPHKPEADGWCDEYEWTGWSVGLCEHCDTEWMWSDTFLRIVAHAPMPAPFVEGGAR